MIQTLSNAFFYLAGIPFLLLSKAKAAIRGYSSPKPYGIQEYDRCIAYDIEVVDAWMGTLADYKGTDGAKDLRGKTVLELGPGSDLGVGLYLLAKSVAQYIAIDVNHLIQHVPDQFYERFFAHLEKSCHVETTSLAEQLHKTKLGQNDRLDYILRKDFDIVAALGSRKVDIVFSQAAFEHFDDVNETIRAISEVTKPGGVLIALIDLQTHSRWIRNQDPNNIYRYPQWLYRMLSTSGTPNRVRPYQYLKALAQYGWKDLVIKPSERLDEKRLLSVKKYLHGSFRDDKNQMDYLGIWLCATKA